LHRSTNKLRSVAACGILAIGLTASPTALHAQGIGAVLQAIGDADDDAKKEKAARRDAEMRELIGPNYERAPETALSPGSREAAGNIAPASLRHTHYNGLMAELTGTDRDPGVPATAAVGDVAFAQFVYFVRPRAELRQDFVWSPSAGAEYNIPRTTELTYGWDIEFPHDPCTQDRLGMKDGRRKKYVCFLDRDGESGFEEVTGIEKFSVRQRPPQPVPYRLVATSIVASKFRQELVYLGRTGDTLRFQYREFQTNLIRPAFTSELTYQAAPTGPTVVKYQNVTLEISRIDNEGIAYVVRSELRR
jgi:hypothetical protein